MLNYNDLKPGTFMVFEGQPYVVMEFHFLRMQQRKPVVQTKIRNIITGKTVEKLSSLRISLKKPRLKPNR